MEKSRGNSTIKIPKAKASNENISPIELEMEDPVFPGRGRFHQSMAMSPTFLSYAENIDMNSRLARYLLAGSPISGKVSPSAAESFTSPTIGSRKNMSGILQQYNSGSSGCSSYGSRNRLSVSPLSSIENLELMPLMSSPVYRKPVKAEEEVLVMDDIQVRLSSSGGKRLLTDVAKKFSTGKDQQRPVRSSISHKYEAHGIRSYSGTGPSTWGPRSRHFRQFKGGTVPEYAVVKTSKRASPVKPEPDHGLANSYTNDWSPLHDNIVLVVPHASSPNNNSPSREDIDAYISRVLYGPSTKRRLPAFAELCS